MESAATNFGPALLKKTLGRSPGSNCAESTTSVSKSGQARRAVTAANNSSEPNTAASTRSTRLLGFDKNQSSNGGNERGMCGGWEDDCKSLPVRHNR